MTILRKNDGIVSKNENCLIFDCSDIPRCHWLLEVQGLTVGINVNSCEIEPALLIRNNRLFIGAEQRVYVVGIDKQEVVYQSHEVSNVQWIEKGHPDRVIFACEDELLALDNFGKLCWRRNLPDVIRSTEIRSGRIDVVDMAGEEHEFDI
jgi:hypothetical protein